MQQYVVRRGDQITIAFVVIQYGYVFPGSAIDDIEVCYEGRVYKYLKSNPMEMRESNIFYNEKTMYYYFALTQEDT